MDFHDDKVIYRRYAGLYFVFCVDVTDNELLYLESIHLFVELLDHYFGNVCELDLVFGFHKVGRMRAGFKVLTSTPDAGGDLHTRRAQGNEQDLLMLAGVLYSGRVCDRRGDPGDKQKGNIRTVVLLTLDAHPDHAQLQSSWSATGYLTSLCAHRRSCWIASR